MYKLKVFYKISGYIHLPVFESTHSWPGIRLQVPICGQRCSWNVSSAPMKNKTIAQFLFLIICWTSQLRSSCFSHPFFCSCYLLRMKYFLLSSFLSFIWLVLKSCFNIMQMCILLEASLEELPLLSISKVSGICSFFFYYRVICNFLLHVECLETIILHSFFDT